MTAALNTVRLYGELGARFGRVHRLAVNSTAEAIRALCVLHKGFEAYMMNARDRGVGFACFLGKENITEDALLLNTRKEIRIAPVLIGSKNGGIFSIILGAALIGISFLIPGAGMFAAALFNAGVAMALGGVVQLLSPQPKDPKSKDKPENTPNYGFNGPINTQAQGHCVPVAYGRPWTGSAVVSAGISVDDVYVPAVSTGDLATWILSTNPTFYYPMTDDPCTDLVGFALPMDLAGNAVAGGDGVTFSGPEPVGSTQGATAALAGGSPWEGAAMCRVRVDDVANLNSGFAKYVFGHLVHYAFGFTNWAFYLVGDDPNTMTPAIQYGNQAGAGTAINDVAPIGVGQTVTLGFRVKLVSGVPRLDLFRDGVLVNGASIPGYSHSGGGAILSTGLGTFRGNVKHCVGWDYAPTDAQMLEASQNILNGYAGTITAGDSTNNPPEEL